MRYLIVILFVLISGSASAAEPDSASLVRSVAELDHALINKDTVMLKRLLKEDVHYYHSNGWVELKRDMTADLYNGKLTYREIKVESQYIRVTGNVGLVKMIVDVDVTMRGAPVKLKLNVLQHWVWKNYKWELAARKSETV